MKRIAIVGANGQVGCEVALRLASVPDVEVIPITRNVSGSAFLRLNGLECRHGKVSDPKQAPDLIGDCDVVVNFALSNTAIPRTDREVNRQISRSLVNSAKPGAAIVLASTIMVYAPSMPFRFPDSYGMEKLMTERLGRRLCRQTGHPFFVFRLGHVLGDLQNISAKINREIREDRVALPHDGASASNTVFTAAIVDAIIQVAQGNSRQGTYDLISYPQWSWLEVYNYYAAQAGLSLRLRAKAKIERHPMGIANPGKALRHFLSYMKHHRAIMERLTFLLAFLPKSVNQRMYLKYLQNRAVAEIETLRASEKVPMCVEDWKELKVRTFGETGDPAKSLALYPMPASNPFR
jgi:nucleoside-diphosphate-sugar epimerase